MLSYQGNRKSLREPGRRVTRDYATSSEFLENIEKMKEILARDGVGLAATQVGWPIQLFMLCIDEDEDSSDTIEPQIFLNPEILKYSKTKTKMEEGCLSFKGLYISISRPASITWKYESLDGEAVTKSSAGFYARAVQHEIDHCHGKVFIDRASAVQKLKIKKWNA